MDFEILLIFPKFTELRFGQRRKGCTGTVKIYNGIRMHCGESIKEIEYLTPPIVPRRSKEIMYIVVRNVGSRILMRMPNAIARNVICLSTVNYQLKDGIKKTVKVCQDTMTKNYTRLIYTVREAQNMYETGYQYY